MSGLFGLPWLAKREAVNLFDDAILGDFNVTVVCSGSKLESV